MKLNTTHNSVSISDDFESKPFGIRSCDMGIILETLRSKMYSNPIGAICREISSNSRDANREVGKGKLPIRIQIDKDLLNPGETTISFIDNGPGISEERMAEIFVNYGGSTKRDTNRLTGAFGFGSKTPFAYSDSFSVITRVGGVKYTYIAAIEENNTGKIYMVNKSETVESNGTSIIIPVKKEDIGSFESECVKATWFWNPRPTYINFRNDFPDRMEVIPYMDDFFVDQKNYNEVYPEYYYLLIDGIPYEVSKGDLKLPDVSYYKKSFFMVFKTGQLTISANRESVQYDHHTTGIIKSKYEKLWKKFKDEIQEKIEACPNQFEACLILQDACKHPLFDHLSHMKENNFTFKGQFLNTPFKFQKLKISCVNEHGKITVDRVDAGMRDGVFFVSTVLSPGRNRAILNKIVPATPDSVVNFFAVEIPKEVRRYGKKPFSEKKKWAKTMRSVLNEIKILENMGIKLLSYSDVIPVIIKNVRKINTDNIGIYIRFQNGNSYGQWENINDIKEGSLYRIDDGTEPRWPDLIYNVFKISTLTIAKRYEKYLIGKFNSLNNYLNTIDKTKFQKYSDYKFLSSVEIRSYDFLRKLKISNFTENDIKLFNKTKEYAYRNLPNDLCDRVPPSNDIKLVTNKLERAIKKYPLLSNFSIYTGAEEVKNYQEYINAIDLLKKEEE